MFQAIQLALRDYQKARIHRALKVFRRSAFALLCSRLGRMALQSAQELSDRDLTPEERRHLATAQVFTTLHDSGINAEDWIVKALVEIALLELESPSPASAMECFYL
jgi:hypothetical protein